MSFILMTLMFDSRVMLYGEIRFWSHLIGIEELTSLLFTGESAHAAKLLFQILDILTKLWSLWNQFFHI